MPGKTIVVRLDEADDENALRAKMTSFFGDIVGYDTIVHSTTEDAPMVWGIRSLDGLVAHWQEERQRGRGISHIVKIPRPEIDRFIPSIG